MYQSDGSKSPSCDDCSDKTRVIVPQRVASSGWDMAILVGYNSLYAGRCWKVKIERFEGEFGVGVFELGDCDTGDDDRWDGDIDAGSKNGVGCGFKYRNRSWKRFCKFWPSEKKNAEAL